MRLDAVCNSACLSPLAISRGDAAALLLSRLSSEALHDGPFIENWIRQAKKGSALRTMLTPLERMEGWARDPESGSICHETGRFFSVIGIHVRHRIDREELEWDQPIIEQPEVGILGILAKNIDGVLHFCLQAKEEPGNIGGVQLSPTVQATYSNYTGAHGGATPLFLEYFIDPPAERLLFARLQTEDGGRFLYKSNRNMVVTAGDDLPVELPEGFIWLTLRQIAGLVKRDNLVNACTRSILSGLFSPGTGNDPANADLAEDGVTDEEPLEELRQRLGGGAGPREEIGATLQWLDDRKAANHMVARRMGLNNLQEWCYDGKGFFSHREGRFFRIVGLQVTTETREVNSWAQPIIENPSSGIIGLLVRRTSHGTEVLMQAKAEAGNRCTVQLGPTVQFTQGNYAGSRKLRTPFLYDEFLEPGSWPVIHESRQAEEGARFYRECHLHRVLLLPEGAELEIPRDYRWLPLQHIVFLLHLGEQVNSCARSILACLI